MNLQIGYLKFHALSLGVVLAQPQPPSHHQCISPWLAFSLAESCALYDFAFSGIKVGDEDSESAIPCLCRGPGSVLR